MIVLFSFLESEIELDKKKILFEDIKSKDGKQLIKFNGTPFVNIGTDTYNCQYGVDRNISTKKKKLNSKVAQYVSMFKFKFSHNWMKALFKVIDYLTVTQSCKKYMRLYLLKIPN